MIFWYFPSPPLFANGTGLSWLLMIWGRQTNPHPAKLLICRSLPDWDVPRQAPGGKKERWDQKGLVSQWFAGVYVTLLLPIGVCTCMVSFTSRVSQPIILQQLSFSEILGSFQFNSTVMVAWNTASLFFRDFVRPGDSSLDTYVIWFITAFWQYPWIQLMTWAPFYLFNYLWHVAVYMRS